MIRAGVVGATGYVGAELIRVLMGHPEVELAAVFGRSRAGVRLDAVHPGLLGLTELVVQPLDPAAVSGLDVVLLALPHGASAAIAAELSAPCVIDLGSDHRHAPGWVYGLAEWAPLQGATRIAAPGCFATTIALALAPLAASGYLRGVVRVAAATGSTGSGAAPQAGTHHPERFVNLKAYKVLRHQHVPEVRALLAGLGAQVELAFVPLSAPVDRGIFAVCFADVPEVVDVDAVYAEAYADRPLVRLRPESPELRHVRGTAFCDLAVHRQGEVVAVLSALDNLGKGAAAQAVQCLNLARGWPSTLGLRTPPLLP